MADRLKEFREKLGYNQQGLAEVAGIRQATWSRGEKEPPEQFEALARLSRHYKVSADYLLGIIDDPAGKREVSADEAVLLAGIRALNKFDQVAVRTLLATLPKEEPEERRFTLEVITRILQPARPQPHIVGEEPNDDAAAVGEPG